MSKQEAVTTIEVEGLRKVASGKVREIFEIDADALLFVATDRISAYDVIMENVSRRSVFAGILYSIGYGALRATHEARKKETQTSPRATSRLRDTSA